MKPWGCGNWKDHPHACGDKLFTCNLFGIGWGSSPRVWGQAISSGGTYLLFRIIPTRVGTSCKAMNDRLFTEDHPHACGDKHPPALVASADIGSSPRVWGQAEGVPSRFIVYRIIPTRVGTRFGEYTAGLDKKGSSPRVWGQAEHLFLRVVILRIIPTRVGTSDTPLADGIIGADHPHACGDKLFV